LIPGYQSPQSNLIQKRRSSRQGQVGVGRKSEDDLGGLEVR
jgi:hypothetical protein